MKHGKRIIKRFYNSMTVKAEKILSLYYPCEIISEISEECRLHYDGVIMRLPYVGGIRNFYTPIIIINGWFICIYKAMHSGGIEDDVIGYVISTSTEELFDKIPGFLEGRIKNIVFSRFFKRYISRQAAKSQKQKYPDDWLYTVNFLKWGKKSEVREVEMKFEECGVHKYYEKEGCENLKKYCNFCDPQYSIRYNLGLDANHTMAQGNNQCSLTFHNSRETIMPDNIVQMSENALKAFRKQQQINH